MKEPPKKYTDSGIEIKTVYSREDLPLKANKDPEELPDHFRLPVEYSTTCIVENSGR
jgi:hypothetical protein